MATLRAFIAVKVSRDVIKNAEQLIRRLAVAGTKTRWAETDQMHITLKFLGEMDVLQTPEVFGAMKEILSEHEDFQFQCGGASAFPDVDRPRTIWMGVGEGSEALEAINESLEDKLMDVGFRREKRRFTPHLTLGRVRSDRGIELLSDLLRKETDCEGGLSYVQEVLMYSSELTPNGPLYNVLGRTPLGRE